MTATKGKRSADRRTGVYVYGILPGDVEVEPGAPGIGEIITDAIDAKRQADTQTLGDVLTGQVTASVLRPPSHELDATYAAFLVEDGKADALREAVDRLARDWQGRIELRLFGPLAAYDFVGTTVLTDAVSPDTGPTR